MNVSGKPASGKIVIKALESQRYSILESKKTKNDPNKTTKNSSGQLIIMIMIDTTIFLSSTDCHNCLTLRLMHKYIKLNLSSKT